ncbi:MAG: InlB B-repeat-containing protein, partial [Clostridia bacterium]|nr:InlB B-repeat-containing protein [Clostridia bacterium]
MKKIKMTLMVTILLLCLSLAACGPATYTVTFATDNSAYGTVSINSIANVEQGAEISVNGNVLTIGTEKVIATPTESTAQYTYSFDKFEYAGTSVTGDMTITAKFTRTTNKYTITFETGEGTAIDPINIDYGTTIAGVLDEVNVTPPAHYHFVKWQLKTADDTYTDLAADATLAENITLAAVYAIDTYTVSIVSDNTAYGTVDVESVANVPYGTVITTSGNTLTIDGTVVIATETTDNEEFDFEFAGFTNGTATVESALTVTANFTRTLKQYTVTFEMGEGTAISPIDIDYGTPVSTLDEVNVIPPAHYHFVKWQLKTGENNYADFEGNETLDRDITVKAYYEIDTFTVTVVSNNDDYGTVDTDSIANVPYGTVLTTSGNTLTIDGTVVIATETTDNEEFDFEFAGFTNGTATVESALTVTANFTRTLKQYTVTFEMGEGTAIDPISIDYGTTIASVLDGLTVTPPEHYRLVKWQIYDGVNYIDILDGATVTGTTSLKAVYDIIIIVDSFGATEYMVAKGGDLTVSTTATAGGNSVSPTYTSSNSNIAIDSDTGAITTTTAGETTITATYGSVSATCTVIVYTAALTSSMNYDTFKSTITADLNGYYMLTGDINLGNIQSSTNKAQVITDDFGGTLNGNGHKITYSSSWASNSTNHDKSIFTTLTSTAVIKNLAVQATYDTTNGVRRAAIAKVNNGLIENCFIDVTFGNIGQGSNGDWASAGVVMTNNGVIN